MPRLVPLPYQKIVRAFEKSGFIIARTTGDHIVMVKKGVVRPLIIPKWSAVPVFIIKNNLRSAQISRDTFLSLVES